MFLLFEVIVFFYDDLVVNYIFYILPNLFDLEKLLLLLNPNPLEVSLVNFVSLDLDFDRDYFRKLSNYLIDINTCLNSYTVLAVKPDFSCELYEEKED